MQAKTLRPLQFGFAARSQRICVAVDVPLKSFQLVYLVCHSGRCVRDEIARHQYCQGFLIALDQCRNARQGSRFIQMAKICQLLWFPRIRRVNFVEQCPGNGTTQLAVPSRPRQGCSEVSSIALFRLQPIVTAFLRVGNDAIHNLFSPRWDHLL